MSSVKDKLYNMEQVPPARAWDKIAAALDESHLGDQFPATLYHAEVAPPTGAWEKIAAGIDSHPKVVQMAAHRPTFLRYAVAACVIGLVALGILMYTGIIGDYKTPDNTELVTTGTTPKPSEESQQTPNQNNLPTREISPDDLVNEERPVIADASPARPVRKGKSNNSVNRQDEGVNAVYAYNDHIPADNYVMLMTPNGFVRMSKKLGDIVCCVAGELEDEDCKDQLKKWQQKMATSTVAPGNVMDILDLASTLNDTDL